MPEKTMRDLQAARCPSCAALDSHVIDTRFHEATYRRRRACDTCGTRFTTYEISREALEGLIETAVDGASKYRRLADALKTIKEAVNDLPATE